ncbi:hypothetical protein FHS90_004004 [Rufibacter quisquiliarum]|uniref:Uncharacterized protein n=1 Tax=Rufibacter quisquiliarum TaxID=1549639 RepID=A0A839GR00_9BACT|nr:hypothetical protein [Rufibacter quisquiliarum]
MLFAFLLLFLPLVVQQAGFLVVKTNLPIRVSIFLTACALGVFLPWQATFLAASALLEGVTAKGQGAGCVTGAVVFLPLGYGITLITFCVGLYGLISKVGEETEKNCQLGQR